MAYYNFKAEGSSGTSAYYLGTLAHGSIMNVASKYEDYANLTAANFLIVPNSGSTSAHRPGSQEIAMGGWIWVTEDTNTASFVGPSVSYNPANGQLSFSCYVSCGGNSYGHDSDIPSQRFASTAPSASAGITAKVYLVPSIENL